MLGLKLIRTFIMNSVIIFWVLINPKTFCVGEILRILNICLEEVLPKTGRYSFCHCLATIKYYVYIRYENVLPVLCRYFPQGFSSINTEDASLFISNVSC